MSTNVTFSDCIWQKPEHTYSMGLIYVNDMFCLQWCRAGWSFVTYTFNSVYIDEHLSRLSAAKLGCYIDNICCGALGYPDDIALLAPTLSSLKYMLNICHQFAEAYDVMFNSSKRKLLFLGRSDSRSCVHVLHVEVNDSLIE